MDIYCVVTGQDERGKSVLVQKKPIEPVRLAQFRVRFFRSRFTGRRNGSITGSKVFDRFQTCFSGTVFDHLVEIPVAAGSWSPAHAQGTQAQVRTRQKPAGQPQVLETQ